MQTKTEKISSLVNHNNNNPLFSSSQNVTTAQLLNRGLENNLRSEVFLGGHNIRLLKVWNVGQTRLPSLVP